MGQLSKQEIELRNKWREEGVVLDPYQGGFWNPEHTRSWIANQNADTLHDFALGFNWSSPGVEPLQAIIENPSCDRATAMTIFSLAAPDYYEATFVDDKIAYQSSTDNAIICLLDAITSVFQNHGFASAKFKMHPEVNLAEWKEYYNNRRQKGEPIRWNLPDRAYQETEGLDHNPQFIFDVSYERCMLPFDVWLKEQE